MTNDRSEAPPATTSPSVALTRRKLLDELAEASLAGNLGMFVGTGLSIAATDRAAPTWAGLLAKVATSLGLEETLKTAQNATGTSSPAIASKLVEALAGGAIAMDRAAREEATRRFKLCVSGAVDVSPTAEMTARLAPLFEAIAPAWCVTTNYDFVLERLLPHAECLFPEQIVRARAGCTPVYHLHGHRLSADSLVITEEDYVRLMHKQQYRQIKLALLFAEATVVTIGYSLTDVNVRAAIELSRSFQPHDPDLRAPEQGKLVVVVRDSNATGDEVRRGPDDEVIVSTREIADFLSELAEARKRVGKRQQRHRALLHDAVHRNRLDGRPFDRVFLEHARIRSSFLQALRTIPAAESAFDVAARIASALDRIARLARGENGWEHYAVWLDVLLDILEEWPFGQLPPTLFDTIASQLVSLAPHLDAAGNRTIGTAFAATALWHRRREMLTKRPLLLKALRDYAELKGAPALLACLPARDRRITDRR